MQWAKSFTYSFTYSFHTVLDGEIVPDDDVDPYADEEQVDENDDLDGEGEKKCCSCLLSCMECWDRSVFLKKVRKIFTFLFTNLSNITFVTCYCLFGAVIFESLEREHEIDVKRSIEKIRNDTLDDIWKENVNVPYVLDEGKFTGEIKNKLREFERHIIKAMR